MTCKFLNVLLKFLVNVLGKNHCKCSPKLSLLCSCIFLHSVINMRTDTVARKRTVAFRNVASTKNCIKEVSASMSVLVLRRQTLFR